MRQFADITVVKVGTGVLTRVEDGTLDGAALVRLVTALSALMDAGHRCLLVSSGAVGSGVSSFQLDGYPRDIVTRQACAAVGQARLMQTYGSLFAHFNITVELPLKAIVRGYSWSVIPITWHNRRSGVAKLKIREMGSRYFFIVAYVWLEQYFSRGDYRKAAPHRIPS